MLAWVNIAPRVIAVIGGATALYLMDRIDRRTNFLWGLGLTALAHLSIVIAMNLLPVGNPAWPWEFLLLIVFMIGSIQLFLNIAVWVYLSEVFPPAHARHRHGSFGLRPVAGEWRHPKAISYLFVLKFVPETRGRTLEEFGGDGGGRHFRHHLPHHRERK